MLQLRLLGPPEVTTAGAAPPAELLWRKHLALLVYLTLSPRRSRTRDHLVGLLWGDKAETAARHSLREAIRVLRQALGADAIETEGQLVRLALPEIRIDTEDFERHVEAESWEAAVGLIAGDFLEGFGVPGASDFEDWLTAQRSEWRGHMVAALLGQAQACLRAGRIPEARRLASRSLTADPLSDMAVRTAMQAEALAGDPAAALDLFGTFQRRARESGVDPSPETAALAERIRGRRRVAPVTASPRPESWTRRAPLVGRAAALTDLVRLWDGVAGGGGAAVALVEGDLGLGKTRVLNDLLDRTELDGAATARALAVRADTQDPDSGLVGLAGGGLLDAPGIAAAPPPALGAIARRLGPWAERFPSASGVEGTSLGAAFRDVVRTTLEEQPLVLAVDEAHWLDASSLGTLQALLRDARDRPLLLVLAVMPSADAPILDELRGLLGGTLAGLTVRLERLGHDELRALAAWALPKYAPDALDRVVRRVAVDSAGIPLLAIELLHAITLGLDPETSVAAWPEPLRTLDQTLPSDLPESIVAAVRIGFRALSLPAQRVLAALAVLPERAPEALIARAVELPMSDARGALDELEWQRWVTADGRGYTFVARLVRDIVGRDMLTAGQRRRIAEAAGLTPA